MLYDGEVVSGKFQEPMLSRSDLSTDVALNLNIQVRKQIRTTYYLDRYLAIQDIAINKPT